MRARTRRRRLPGLPGDPTLRCLADAREMGIEAVAVFGYLPKWVLGGSEHISFGVAREWRAAGLHKNGIIMDDDQETEEKVKVIRDCLKATSDR